MTNTAGMYSLDCHLFFIKSTTDFILQAIHNSIVPIHTSTLTSHLPWNITMHFIFYGLSFLAENTHMMSPSPTTFCFQASTSSLSPLQSSQVREVRESLADKQNLDSVIMMSVMTSPSFELGNAYRNLSTQSLYLLCLSTFTIVLVLFFYKTSAKATSPSSFCICCFTGS